MKLAALYDIHANLPALEAVLDDVRRAGVHLVVLGGDVLPGPMPAETMSALAALDMPVKTILGNGEVAVLQVRAGAEPMGVPEQHRAAIRWSAGQLTADQERRLRAWPATLRLRLDGIGDVLFCHATPRSDTEIFTRATREERVAPAFAGVGAALVVCGHTHMAFDRRIAGVRVVNAGSVGMPFGEPGAYWLLFDGGSVEFRRTEYNVEAAAARIRETAYPGAAAFAESCVVHPPGEAAMLEIYAGAEMK